MKKILFLLLIVSIKSYAAWEGTAPGAFIEIGTTSSGIQACQNLITSYGGGGTCDTGYCNNLPQFGSNWYTAYCLPTGTEPCEDPTYQFNSETGNCEAPPSECPSGQTMINGQCVPNVYCPSLNGYISANLSCPPDNPQNNCPGGTSSCFGGTYGDSAESGQGSGSSGADSNGNSGGSQDSGCGGSGCGSQDQAQGYGGSQGAQQALQDKGQQNGMSQSDIDALRTAADQAAQSGSASASDISSAVMGACMQMGHSVQTCGELGIASANGYQSGGNNAANEWQWGQSGGSQGQNYICSGEDCGYIAFGCPAGYQWNGDSNIAQCVPITNPQSCTPTVYNNFCSEITMCQQAGGVWNRQLETCMTAVAVNECPANTTLQNGQCVSNQSGPIACEAGATWTGTSCQIVPNSTSTTINNTDGSTTTYYYSTTNNYEDNSENEGAGDCDPTATNYSECIGQTEVADESLAGDIKSEQDQTAQSKIDEYTEAMTDFVNDNQSLDSESGVIESMLTGLIPTAGTCSAQTVSFAKISVGINCEKLNQFKVYFGWFLYIITVYYLFHLALTPIESKV